MEDLSLEAQHLVALQSSPRGASSEVTPDLGISHPPHIPYVRYSRAIE